MLELLWRPRAHLDRESIAIHLGVERQAPQATRDSLLRIDEAIDHMRSLPDSGGRFTALGLRAPAYRTVCAGRYIVFYRYDSTALTVYRILHQRQDIDAYTLIDLP